MHVQVGSHGGLLQHGELDPEVLPRLHAVRADHLALVLGEQFRVLEVRHREIRRLALPLLPPATRAARAARVARVRVVGGRPRGKALTLN